MTTPTAPILPTPPADRAAKIARLQGRLVAIDYALDGKALDPVNAASGGDEAGNQSLQFMSVTDLLAMQENTRRELAALRAAAQGNNWYSGRTVRLEYGG